MLAQKPSSAATVAAVCSQCASPRVGAIRDAKLVDLAKRAQERAGDLVWRHDVVGLADFGLPSTEPRMHLVYLEAGLIVSYLVSHGDGSDPEHDGWLNWFSNEHDSHCTSEGTYVTYSWYHGKFGTSMRLEGLDETNSNALDRAIVMHPATYAERAHLDRWGRLGRSNGCFAMGFEDFQRALIDLGGGRVLHAGRFGLAPDGSIAQRPVQARGEIRPLTPIPPRAEDILLPGAS